MEPNETTLTAEHSLQTIQSMIATAKRSFQKISFYFLLWGVLMSLAGMLEFVLTLKGYPRPYLGWPIAGVLGGIVAALHGAKQGQKSDVTTFTDKVMMFLWGSYTVSLILIIVGSVVSGTNPNKFVLLLTGLPTFATGALIGSRHLMAGGIIFWSFGIVTFFVADVYAPLLFSIALAIGYIFPGIMLKRANQ